jgi:hypothetical protein
MSPAEMAESLQELFQKGGITSVTCDGPGLEAGGHHYRMVVGDVGLREVFTVLDGDSLPMTIVTTGGIRPEVRFQSERITTELRVLKVSDFLAPPFLAAELARIGKVPAAAVRQKKWGHLERQSDRLQRGYAALQPMGGLRTLHAEMSLYLQGGSDRLPELFGRPEKPDVFCEYWVHFWFKIFALYAYKLGMAGKEAGLINP